MVASSRILGVVLGFVSSVVAYRQGCPWQRLKRLATKARLATALVMALGLVNACAGPNPLSHSPRPQEEGRPRHPRVLRKGIQREPTMLNPDLNPGLPVAGGVVNIYPMVHNTLVVQNDRNMWIPQLAVEQISTEQGTWRLNADGTMDTVWRIHPNVRWHDGTPFTSADLVFSFSLYKDPAIPNRLGGRALALMDAVSAPDPTTFVVHWSMPYVNADRAEGLIPLPRHLMADLYANDKSAILEDRLLSMEFVGLGPYRLVRWELGSHLELSRFSDYYLGRPPLDGVVVHFLGDPNAMVTAALAGSVDVVLPSAVGLDAALAVMQQWEGTENKVLFVLTDSLRRIEVQHRPEFARPPNGLSNPLVRRACITVLIAPPWPKPLPMGWDRLPIAGSPRYTSFVRWSRRPSPSSCMTWSAPTGFSRRPGGSCGRTAYSRTPGRVSAWRSSCATARHLKT